MFDFYRIEEQVYRLIGHRVDLENGAYLIFDRTEALTAIDVNTGRYIGATELEETVFETNLLAAREIARQVRLRNIGGIVVVDFIDMSSPHRAAVARSWSAACARIAPSATSGRCPSWGSSSLPAKNLRAISRHAH